MTAVSAPPTAASLAAPSNALAPAGDSAVAGNNAAPADFASMLRALQAMVAKTGSAEDSPLGLEVAAVLNELKPLPGRKGEPDENAAAVDIASLLGQLGGQATPPAMLPALNHDAKLADSFALAGKEEGQAGKTSPGITALLPTTLADDATSSLKKDRTDATAEFSLPESLASDAANLRGGEINPGRGPHADKAKLDIATPVQSPNWSAEVGQRVVWMARNNVQEAQLSVNPPHLGPIEITLSLKDDNASARFFSPHAEVREALEQALPRLREMLAGAGVQLGQSDVGAQSQQAFQQFAGRQNGSDNGHPTFSEEHPSLSGQPAVNKTAAVRTLQGNGLVDTFV